MAVLREEHKNIDIAWLDPGRPFNLYKRETTLIQALADAALERADAGFLFGNGCHPDMCGILNSRCGKIIEAKNCVKAFCHESYDELEQNRTMVITPGWTRFFPNMMAAAIGMKSIFAKILAVMIGFC